MSVAAVISSAAEAEGLVRWAIVFAVADPDERLTLISTGGKVVRQAIETAIETCKAEESASPITEIKVIEDPADESDPRPILAAIDECSADLLFVGKNRRPGVSEESLKISRALFDQAPCTTILLRLGNRQAGECDNILIPSAGGQHSREALQLGYRVTRRFDGSITALFIEPEIGSEEDGHAVGLRILDRVLAEADIEPVDQKGVHRRIIVANNTESGICDAAGEEPYDLVLIGASHSGNVRRKLFGAVPDRLLKGEDGMAVAVIRRSRTTTERMRERIGRFFSLRIPQLTREDRIALYEDLQTRSRWNFDFMALMILSTGIASLGLIQSSPAVVIGAMLVAPLMTPLLGSGLALVQGNLPLMRDSLRAIVLGFFAAVTVGFVTGLLAPLPDLTSELLARGGPTLLDFGVAFLSGIAASYCIARPGLSSALAGVAIAAALVPPIATVGISLGMFEFVNARGAALLFGTNVVAIILGSSLNFFAAGIRGKDGPGHAHPLLWVRRTIVGLLIVAGFLLIPLSTAIVSRAAARFGSFQSVSASVSAFVEEELVGSGFSPDITECRITAIRHSSDRGTTIVDGIVRTDRDLPESIANQVAEFARKKLDQPRVEVRLRVEPVTVGTAVAPE